MITETLHCGDNLEYMKTLPSNSIDLIYNDLLYGTGRNFGDYKDIKADRKTVEDFYIPRITEMHRLLKDTGSIYLQMDTRINHWMRCIMDDVFGYNNFRNEGHDIETSFAAAQAEVLNHPVIQEFLASMATQNINRGVTNGV